MARGPGCVGGALLHPVPAPHGAGPERFHVVEGAEPQPEFPEKPRQRPRSHVPGEASLLSPERGLAGPGHSRASVSIPGIVLASLRLTLEWQLLPPSLPRFVHSAWKCWVRPPARPVSGPPGTRLTAVPWRAPRFLASSEPRSAPARWEPALRAARRQAAVRLRSADVC